MGNASAEATGRAGQSCWSRAAFNGFQGPAIFALAQLIWSVLPMPVGLSPLVAAAASTALFMGLALYVSWNAARTLRQAGERWLLVGLGLALWLAPTALRLKSGVDHPVLRAMADCGLLSLAAAAGTAGATAMPDLNILLPVGLFIGAVDFFVVHYGTVAVALEHPVGQQVMQALTVRTPPTQPGLPGAMVGFADILLLAFFYSCIRRFGLRERASSALFFLALGGTLWAVQVDWIKVVPALIPMGAAFLVANWGCFRLSRQEWLLTGGLAACVALFYLWYLLWMRPAINAGVRMFAG
ncbi:MAG: hypothetical protein HY320_05705 [Armatimonadetes bacterium]|nr:hypothetical protein [Armatimonadota bacterium]